MWQNLNPGTNRDLRNVPVNFFQIYVNAETRKQLVYMEKDFPDICLCSIKRYEFANKQSQLKIVIDHMGEASTRVRFIYHCHLKISLGN